MKILRAPLPKNVGEDRVGRCTRCGTIFQITHKELKDLNKTASDAASWRSPNIVMCPTEGCGNIITTHKVSSVCGKRWIAQAEGED